MKLLHLYVKFYRKIIQKDERIALTGTMLIALFCAVLSAITPIFLKNIIDFLGMPDAGNGRLIKIFGIYLALIFFTRSTNEVRWAFYGAAEQKIRINTSNLFFTRIFQQPVSFFLSHNPSEVTTMMNAGVEANRQMMVNMIFVIVPSIIHLLVASFVLLAFGHAWVSIILAGYAVVFILFNYFYTTYLTGLNRKGSQTSRRAAALFGDAITNFEAIHYFSAAGMIFKRYQNIAAEMMPAWKIFHRRRAANGLIQGGVFSITLGVCLIITVREVLSGNMSIGNFILVNGIVFQVCQPLEAVALSLRDIKQGAVQMEPFLELLFKPIVARNTFSTRSVPATPNTAPNPFVVSLKHVSFAHEGQQNSLSDVSFNVLKGTVVAVVGPTGAGKSTITKLITGLYAPTSGTIDLASSSGSTNPTLAVVPQDVVLFDDTLRFNIGLGKANSTEAAILAAAENAELAALLARSPEGLDTVAGTQGLRLSGGERQRVAIARALLADPDILILDEATSSLDVLTEARIVETLSRAGKSKAIIVIAHRYASIRHVDQVIVLEQGRISARGTPRALALENGWFAEMVRRNVDTAT